MTKHLLRSYPYFQVIGQTKSPKSRKQLVKLLPDYAIRDLFEILYNVVHGGVHITPSQKRALKRYKTPILKLLKAFKKSSTRSKRNAVYKQSGGFISTLLPIALGLLAASTSS